MSSEYDTYDPAKDPRKTKRCDNCINTRMVQIELPEIQANEYDIRIERWMASAGLLNETLTLCASKPPLGRDPLLEASKM